MPWLTWIMMYSSIYLPTVRFEIRRHGRTPNDRKRSSIPVLP